MDFGLLPEPTPEQKVVKQYVNLERQDVSPSPHLVCWPEKIQPANHGKYIYIEAAVDPPIPNVAVTIKYEDPQFNYGDSSDPMAGNQPPTNQMGAGYSASSNPDLLQKEQNLLWGSHKAYGHDRVYYGDNYNYCPGYDDYVGFVMPPIPDGDPILEYPDESNPRVPLNFTKWQGGVFESWTPEIDVYTNIHGRAAVLFYTGGHGGDNFKFKAYKKLWLNQWDGSEECVDCEEECDNCERCGGNCSGCGPYCEGCTQCTYCLRTRTSIEFQVWREFFIDYAGMPVRTQFPNPWCETEDGSKQIEYIGNHDVASQEYFTYYNGVYDDCFIEITKGIDKSDGQYYLALDNIDRRPAFGSYYYNWSPSTTDRVLILGVDHIENVCEKNCGNYGITPIEPGNFENKKYICMIAVGFIADDLRNDNDRLIDNIIYEDNNYRYPQKNSAAHELTHNLKQSNDHLLTYGLMCPGDIEYVSIEPPPGFIGPVVVPAKRSYHHLSDIMSFRKTTKFDSSDY
jgi:hypothetical protein